MLPNELEVLLNENKWEEAIEYISHLGTPLDDELLSQLAWCNSRAGRYDLAIELYDEMIQRQPQMAKWYYSKGYQFYMQKKWQDAIALFEMALNLFEDFFIVKYRLAYAYIQVSGNRMQWSTDTFWKAIKQLEDCHKIYASYSDENKRKEEATYADVCALHGKTIMMSDKYLDKSIALLNQASNLKSDDIDIKYELSKAYYAKKLYNEALNVLPNIEKPYYIPELRGLILSEIGEYAEANSIIFGLVKYRKKDYLFRRLAENYIKLGCLDEAEKNVNKAIQINQRNYKNYFTAGLVYYEKKYYQSAIVSFEKSRTVKAQQYNTDCAEAIIFIEKINAITENNPKDPIDEFPKASHYIGQVIKYNSERGFGFLNCPILKENIFFHISNYPSQQPIIGSSVVFEIETTQKGTRAINIAFS